MPVGFVGARRADGLLNLYYRFSFDSHGHGPGKEASTATPVDASGDSREWQSRHGIP
jgi:hypothetical protein